MSAIAANFPRAAVVTSTTAPPAVPDELCVTRERGPRLTSLPTGADAAGMTRSGAVPMRLTRFARLSLTVAALAVVIALGVGLSSQLASATTTTRPVTVDAGQTLSQIAARERPDLNVRDAVVVLQLANGLSTAQIHAGQRLVIPAP